MILARLIKYICLDVFRDATGKFPDYPGEDEGGSGAIFKEKDPADVEAELRSKVSCMLLSTHVIN